MNGMIVIQFFIKVNRGILNLVEDPTESIGSEEILRKAYPKLTTEKKETH